MLIKNLRTEFGRWSGVPESWCVLAAAAYVFLAPNVDFVPHLTWHDGQRIAQLVLMGVTVVLGLAVPRTGNAIVDIWARLPRWSRAVLFAAFALGVLSVLRAPLWRWAMLEWAMLLLLVVVMLGIAAGRLVGGTSVDRLLVVVVFAMAAAYAMKTIAVYLAMLTIGVNYTMELYVRDLYTGFSNIRFFGHVQTMLLPFLLLPAMWWATVLRQRILLGAVPALWWMLVVASGTRGTWVALTAGVLAVLFYGGHAGRRWIKWQVAGLLCGLLCYAVFILLVPDLLGLQVSFMHRTGDITSLSLREVIWAAAMEFARENPLLGLGPMHFAYYANAVAAHPHNAILQFMAEWGIPAALLFTVVFAAGGLVYAGQVKRTTAGADAQTGLTAVALLAALAGAAAQAMVDGILVMPVSQILLATICGWALGLYFSRQSGAAQCGSVEKKLGAVIVMLAAGSIIVGVRPELGQLEQREAAYVAAHPPGTVLLPRFWAQGWINP